MSREALVLLVCCCDFRDRAERLIPSKSLRNAVIRAFPGLFCILRMCAPRRAAAVVRPRGREKSADRRRRILISRLLIIRTSVPRRKSLFPAYFKGFPAVSLLFPPYPAFLKYPVSPHLWSSISLLIGIVIAILALVRGRMLLPLLLAVFALWLLWWLLAQALPLWRNNRAYRVKEAQLREQKAPANSGGQLADALLCHVNYRITAMLHAAYPNARWEWLDEPSRFAVEGGTARIRVYGIPEHDYADVKLDQKANLDCSLVKLSPLMPGSPDAQPPNRQPVNPRIWFETRGRAVLEALVTDLNSRGHSSLTVQENGEIFVQTKENETEPAKEAFLDFPEKVYWPQLVKVLESEGYAADARDADILVSW